MTALARCYEPVICSPCRQQNLEWQTRPRGAGQVVATDLSIEGMESGHLKAYNLSRELKLNLKAEVLTQKTLKEMISPRIILLSGSF